MKYEGHIANGKKQGMGRLFENNQLVYEGGFDNDLFNGLGKLL